MCRPGGHQRPLCIADRLGTSMGPPFFSCFYGAEGKIGVVSS